MTKKAKFRFSNHFNRLSCYEITTTTQYVKGKFLTFCDLSEITSYIHLASTLNNLKISSILVGSILVDPAKESLLDRRDVIRFFEEFFRSKEKPKQCTIYL